jgi:hypothetical protein
MNGLKIHLLRRVLFIVHCSQFRCPAAILVKDDAHVRCAGIFKQSMGARNRVVWNGLSYPPARLHSLAELVPWNRFLGSLKV